MNQIKINVIKLFIKHNTNKFFWNILIFNILDAIKCKICQLKLFFNVI